MIVASGNRHHGFSFPESRKRGWLGGGVALTYRLVAGRDGGLTARVSQERRSRPLYGEQTATELLCELHTTLAHSGHGAQAHRSVQLKNRDPSGVRVYCS